MSTPTTSRRRLPRVLVAAMMLIVLAVPTPALAVTSTAVLDWNGHAIRALSNASAYAAPCAAQTPPVAALHIAMVQGAIYDAVNAIDGGHQPYLTLTGLPAGTSSASIDAAVATAAHDVLVGRDIDGDGDNDGPRLCASIVTDLDALWASSVAGIAEPERSDGIAVGAAAATAMLAARADDGRFGAPGFPVSDPLEAGDWRPLSSAPTANDPFGWVRDVDPFVLNDASQVRTGGPKALGSAEYAKEYNEVKSLGSASSTTRSAAQTTLARFYTEGPQVLWNRTFRDHSAVQALTPAGQARLFAMMNLGAADSAIGCFDDKAYWNFWRPTTAIALAATDGNAATNPPTAAEGTWASLIGVPPYPDHPSGYNCFSSGVLNSARGFFGTDMFTFTVHSNAIGGGPDRQYTRFSLALKDTIDARVYAGLHFRSADVQGAWIGKTVARWLQANYFQPTN